MNLELYHVPSCGYCRKVRDFIDARDLQSSITYIDISGNPEARDKLEEATGATTVPVLFIDGEAKPESQDIIDWLDDNVDRIKSQ